MAKACFCGCGRNIPFGRLRIANHVGDLLEQNVAILEGLQDRGTAEAKAEATSLLPAGRDYLAEVTEYVHGQRDRDSVRRKEIQDYCDTLVDLRKRLASSDDFPGWDAWDQSALYFGGEHAPGEIVHVSDTGTTINANPRVELTIRVSPTDGAPFDVQHRRTVSRLQIPRVGEHVDVAYDPEDHEKVALLVRDLTDDALATEATATAPAAADPLDRLAKLQDLRERGALTEAEFAAQKAKLLEDV
jgi:Short C-terminal domain